MDRVGNPGPKCDRPLDVAVGVDVQGSLFFERRVAREQGPSLREG